MHSINNKGLPLILANKGLQFAVEENFRKCGTSLESEVFFLGYNSNEKSFTGIHKAV